MQQALPALLLEIHTGIEEIRDTLKRDEERVKIAADQARLAQLEQGIEDALQILSDRHENYAIRVYRCQKFLKGLADDPEQIPF